MHPGVFRVCQSPRVSSKGEISAENLSRRSSPRKSTEGRVKSGMLASS